MRRTKERAANLIPVDPTQKEEARSRTFVRQLILVAAEDPDIDHALICYLRFATERIRLAEVGDVTELDWIAFFSDLEERWRRVARVHTSDRSISDEEALGRTILRKTVDDGFCAHLAGQQTTAEYFTSGGYHRLADDERVWWHPSYSDKVKPQTRS
ncbi:MAG: hypothetical protein KDD11_07050 [Acidobacteria bacterium]|nr:hypothetical protein [Acidobacteriota bacterium]